jgi:hypothetical protein
MKITNSSTNTTLAVEAQQGFGDRNLPVYLTKYTILPAQQFVKTLEILWSTVSLLPSPNTRERILTIQISAQLTEPLPTYTSSISNFSMLLDFSSIEESIRLAYPIQLEGQIEGYVTYGAMSTSLNANYVMNYVYAAEKYQLLLNVTNLPSVPPDVPIPFYCNISIQDDVYGEDNPALLPFTVSNNILRFPQAPGPLYRPNRGEGITAVLLLLICCPDELATLQLSTLDPSLPGAFDPRSEIAYLLNVQGLLLPTNGFDIEYIPAVPYDPSPEPPMLNWRTSQLILHMAFELQNLFSNAPDMKAIVLYEYLPVGPNDAPAYISWLRNNMSKYDMFLSSQMINRHPGNDYSPDDFEAAKLFYNDTFRTLYLFSKPCVISGTNSGSDEQLQRPNARYNFQEANSLNIVSTGMSLDPDAGYNINGPYIASSFNGGGYCNDVPQPVFQFDIVSGVNYGCPDICGYNSDIAFCMYSGSLAYVVANSGSSWTPQPLGALMAMIMVNTKKRDWDFKRIFYLKGSSIFSYINKGWNTGSGVTGFQNRYDCSRFQFWNPVCGMGSIYGSYLYEMCDLMMTNTNIQISAVGMNNRLSFLNTIPRNTFADFVALQPVLGYSSIFSMFKILSITNPNTSASEVMLTNKPYYILDGTLRYALAYGIDDNGIGYIFLQTFNPGSTFQQWIFRNRASPGVVQTIFAFDNLYISPSENMFNYMTSHWNANNSLRPSCPSFISTLEPSVTEYFTISREPAIDKPYFLIMENIANDTDKYSYYVNITAPIGDGNVAFLSNPDFIDPSTSTVNEIYAARNAAFEQDISPRWGEFSKYPQWVVIPITIPYSYKLILNQPVLLFNTVLGSYLRVDPVSKKPILKPNSADTNAPLSQFLFYINNRSFEGEVFEKTVVEKPGLPKTVPFDISTRRVALVNAQMIRPPYNGREYFYYYFVRPNGFNELLDLYETNTADDDYVYLNLYWVFKRLMITTSTICQMLAFNNYSTDPQPNNGKYVSARRDNVYNHAPSMTADVEDAFTNFYYEANTVVLDVNAPNTNDNSYIYVNENYQTPGSTNLKIIELGGSPTSQIGVCVTGPQTPIMLDIQTQTDPNVIAPTTK